MSFDYGLIFDVDGVIADTEAVNARASIKVFEGLLGIPGVTRKDFAAGLGRGAEAYVRAAAIIHGVDLSAEQVKEATAARQDNFLEELRAEPLPAFPGVLGLIDSARADERFGLAIATSSTKAKSEAVLKSAKIPYLEMIYVNGDDVTRKKPNPQLFLIAAERLGVDPARCVVIEDAPDGVAAAKSAGAVCIAVTNSTSAANLGEADHIVDSVEEISLELLLELLAG